MKKHTRYIQVSAAAVLVLAVLYLIIQATEPESAIILRERNSFADSSDKAQSEKDPVQAAVFRDKISFLDYRLALAYTKEDRPDQAIAVLQKLIADAEASGKGGMRRSRSYLDEEKYYEALQVAYGLQGDEPAIARANQRRDELMARAEEAKQREHLSEGRSVGMNGE